MKTILVTGGTGYIGQALLRHLSANDGFSVRAAVRTLKGLPSRTEAFLYKGLECDADWVEALLGVSIVVHAAARAHVINDNASDPLSEFRRVNVEGTLNFARQASFSGVSRFVFISSIGVYGHSSSRPFTEEDELHPEDPFAIAKYEAEIGLQLLSEVTGMEITIIRPPLVYGPGAPGNFGRLVSLVASGVPLPLGSVYQNRRSLVALDNLIDLILTCIDHPAAANQVFLAGDGVELSTTELLQCIAKAMGKPARLLPVPVKLIEIGAALLGKQAMAQRLLGSLQVDISKARELLGWVPPVSMNEGLKRAVAPLGTHQGDLK